MRLFIVRHGETLWNREGRFQGQQDTDLSEFGLAQAHHGTARAGLQVPQHVQHHVVERPGLVQASR